jgi:diadenosine tetraphosphate (Ap4A) HIT family hydrolase
VNSVDHDAQKQGKHLPAAVCLITRDSLSSAECAFAHSISADCPFCRIEKPVSENAFAYIRRDNFLVAPGHLLVCPKRHIASFFDLTAEESAAMFSLVAQCRKIIEIEVAPDGYNVGINVGEAAGQTVMHLHVHVIPRHFGDVPRRLPSLDQGANHMPSAHDDRH